MPTPIRELKANAKEILAAAQEQANKQLGGKVTMDLVSKVQPDGRIYVEQGRGGRLFRRVPMRIYARLAEILRGKSCGNGEFKFSVYPDSMPTYLELVKNGAVADICQCGRHLFRECFCGPCFGAGDTPANGEFSIRSHHPQLPQPGGFQARRGPDQRGGPHGTRGPLRPRRPTAAT